LNAVESLARLCIHYVCVRIVNEKFLCDAAAQYPKAAKYLAAWTKTVRAAEWRNMADGAGATARKNSTPTGSASNFFSPFTKNSPRPCCPPQNPNAPGADEKVFRMNEDV